MDKRHLEEMSFPIPQIQHQSWDLKRAWRHSSRTTSGERTWTLARRRLTTCGITRTREVEALLAPSPPLDQVLFWTTATSGAPFQLTIGPVKWQHWALLMTPKNLWTHLNCTHFALLCRHRHWSHWSFLGRPPEDDSFSYLSICAPKFSDLARLHIQWRPSKSVVRHLSSSHREDKAALTRKRCSSETLSKAQLFNRSKRKSRFEGLWQQRAPALIFELQPKELFPGRLTSSTVESLFTLR